MDGVEIGESEMYEMTAQMKERPLREYEIINILFRENKYPATVSDCGS